MKAFLLLMLFLGCFSGITYAQYEPVFPDLTGQDLRDNVIATYKPTAVLDYGDNKDIIFSQIDKRGDSLYCVYSKHAVHATTNSDPSVYVYQNGSNDGMNAEHTYPQSKGALPGNPKSDMHHLFPTRIYTNSARGNLPFAELDDNLTETWYIYNQQQSNKPTSNIDAYSERIANVGFEPREDHKGNTARAMFYFYTMYQAQADSQDPNYFESQRETLCDWHIADPVDWDEWLRNDLVAIHQGTKNPYILDCTLAERVFCPNITAQCVSWNEVQMLQGTHSIIDAQHYPNPVEDVMQIHVRLQKQANVSIYIYDAYGRELEQVAQGFHHKGAYIFDWQRAKYPSGLYFYAIEVQPQGLPPYRVTQKMILK